MWSPLIRIDRVFPPAGQVAPLLLSIFLFSGCLASQDAKRGDQHSAAGNWEEAILAYKEALKNDPFDPALNSKYTMARERAAALYEERGQALLKERQMDLAIEQFKRALTIEPTGQVHQASLAEATRFKDARVTP
jgi:general secretion pathway protein D